TRVQVVLAQRARTRHVGSASPTLARTDRRRRLGGCVARRGGSPLGGVQGGPRCGTHVRRGVCESARDPEVMRRRFLREAESELVETARYYDANTPGLGAEFLDEVERTLVIAGRHPALGRSVMGEYRRVLTTRFPYALVYRVVGDELVIV